VKSRKCTSNFRHGRYLAAPRDDEKTFLSITDVSEQFSIALPPDRRYLQHFDFSCVIFAAIGKSPLLINTFFAEAPEVFE